MLKQLKELFSAGNLYQLARKLVKVEQTFTQHFNSKTEKSKLIG